VIGFEGILYYGILKVLNRGVPLGEQAVPLGELLAPPYTDDDISGDG
jgi:hypothetical protein